MQNSLRLISLFVDLKTAKKNSGTNFIQYIQAFATIFYVHWRRTGFVRLTSYNIIIIIININISNCLLTLHRDGWWSWCSRFTSRRHPDEKNRAIRWPLPAYSIIHVFHRGKNVNTKQVEIFQTTDDITIRTTSTLPEMFPKCEWKPRVGDVTRVLLSWLSTIVVASGQWQAASIIPAPYYAENVSG